jgi:hypothetical protein
MEIQSSRLTITCSLPRRIRKNLSKFMFPAFYKVSSISKGLDCLVRLLLQELSLSWTPLNRQFSFIFRVTVEVLAPLVIFMSQTGLESTILWVLMKFIVEWSWLISRKSIRLKESSLLTSTSLRDQLVLRYQNRRKWNKRKRKNSPWLISTRLIFWNQEWTKDTTRTSIKSRLKQNSRLKSQLMMNLWLISKVILKHILLIIREDYGS